MRVYLSGPITGVKNYKENFAAAEEKMKKMGFDVINPAAFNRVLPEMGYEEYMDIDLKLLAMCDVIYMLKDWEKSRGANREYGFALGADITIIQEELEERTKKVKTRKEKAK